MFFKKDDDSQFGSSSKLRGFEDEPSRPPTWAWIAMGVVALMAINLHFGWVDLRSLLP